MHIWELTPLEPNARAWARSTYNGVVFVRADSEEEARSQVMAAYVLGASVVPGDFIEFCPWEDPAQVSARIVEDSEYRVDGEVAIVGP